MIPELELHPALTRLRRRLELCQAPLIRLWAWPESGRRLLLSNLSHFHPQHWRELDPGESLVDQITALDSGIPHLWCSADLEAAGLEAVRQALAVGQRLYFPSQRPPLELLSRGGLLLEDLVRPQEWRLHPGEVASLMEDPFEDASVDSWLSLTAGWWGPLRWASRSETGLDSPGFAHWLEDRVLALLTPLHREILDACRLTGCSDPALWRAAWVRSPKLLQAVEELVHHEGWLGDAWPRLWQVTPWTLDRQVDALGPRRAAARQKVLHRQLGLAADLLGQRAASRHHLRLSDRPQWATRRAAAGSLDDAAPRGGVVGSAAAEGNALARAYEIHLLGLPEVFDISEPGAPRAVHWKLRRAFMTLAYLALAPDRQASREEIIDHVWEGVDGRGIDKNFHPTLSTLRRALGSAGADRRCGPLRFRRGVYSLSPEVTWSVDVDRFRQLIAEGDVLWASADDGSREQGAAIWQRAWRLYRGPLLAEAEESWVVGRRRELRHTYIRLLRHLGTALADLQRFEGALDVYRTLLVEEPFEEQIHLAIMQIYGSQGRRDLVRRQFVRLQELLRSELGVEPMAVTQERFDQLMA